MNSLTVNLHLMMTTFYRPSAAAPCILIDEPAFPVRPATPCNRRFAITGSTQLTLLLSVGRGRAKSGARRGHGSAAGASAAAKSPLVLWNGVNFLTGQYFDLPAWRRRPTATAASSASTSPTRPATCRCTLHEWRVDFAVWCSYKYLNARPGRGGWLFRA